MDLITLFSTVFQYTNHSVNNTVHIVRPLLVSPLRNAPSFHKQGCDD
jgi:hypothetical protein